MANSPSKRSSRIFPAAPAASLDDAAKLTTSYQPIVGLGSAKTSQLNVVATFAAETDTVIIQIEKNGVTQNLTYSYSDFYAPYNFVAGDYRLVADVRGYGITAARIGLSSTATVLHADLSAVC